MPKFPDYASRTGLVTGSVFEKFRATIKKQGENLVKLHLGDCYSPPPYGLPLHADFVRAHPGFNRYCDTFGVAELRDAIADKLRTDNGLEVDRDNVMMTCGASNALNITAQALVEPGEDVMVLAPYWPFFRGMVRVAGGKPVEVPFYTRLYDEPDMDIGGCLEGYVTPNTTVLYVNTPNNPSGKVLDRKQLDQIAAFAREHDLWLITDEAYDGMTYDGNEHISVASFPGMFDRTISIFTFSKVYMFSGLRLGYVVANPGTLTALNKIMVHQLYSPATVSQQMMVTPVKTRAEWRGRFLAEATRLRNLVVDGLRISPRKPEGSYYLFFDVAGYLAGREYWGLVEDCLDGGVSVAPGEDFGRDYASYIRICFTAEPPDRVALAVNRLNDIFPG